MNKRSPLLGSLLAETFLYLSRGWLTPRLQVTTTHKPLAIQARVFG